MAFDQSMTDLESEQSEERRAIDLDITASFSTTESIPSETYRNMADITHKPEELSTSFTDMPTSYLPTVETYDAWASIYDTDGNILQAVDDMELETLLPSFFTELLSTRKDETHLRILDLGCGTGRNTMKILTYPWPDGIHVSITGIDASAGMLAIAQRKLSAEQNALTAQGQPST